MRNAQTMKLVKITTVLTHVSHLVDKVQIVELKTMLQFADAQEEILEIHSKYEYKKEKKWKNFFVNYKKLKKHYVIFSNSYQEIYEFLLCTKRRFKMD